MELPFPGLAGHGDTGSPGGTDHRIPRFGILPAVKMSQGWPGRHPEGTSRVSPNEGRNHNSCNRGDYDEPMRLEHDRGCEYRQASDGRCCGQPKIVTKRTGCALAQCRVDLLDGRGHVVEQVYAGV